MNEPLEIKHTEFSKFNEVYRDQILPGLIATDMERRRLVSGFKKTCAIIALFVICASAFVLMQGFSKIALIFVAVLAFGGVAVAMNKLSAMKLATKSLIMEKICEHLGWTFSIDNFETIGLGNFISYGLLRKHDRSKFEDHLAGLARGVKFVLHEAHLEDKRTDKDGKTKWVTVFRGVLIKLEFPRKFLGETVVLRDAGLFNRKKRNGLKRVGLVDPKFEKTFEAYGSDQVEARYLLTPTFMQSLLDLETTLSGQKMRAIFIGGNLLIAIEAPNQFEAGSMFKPLTEPGRVQKILDEIGTIFDIADIVSRR